MKKILFFFGIASFLFASCGKSNSAKIITEKNYPAEGITAGGYGFSITQSDEAETAEVPPSTVREYDKNGNLTKEIFLNTDGSTMCAYTYEYEKKLETKRTKYSAAQAVEQVCLSEYEKGKIVKSTTLSALGNTEYTDTFKYSDNIVEQATFAPNGETISLCISELDGKGRKMRENRPFCDIVIVTDFEYDDNDRIVKQTEDNGGFVTVWAFAYDKFGNVTEKTTTFPDGSKISETYTYKYNADNEWTQKECFCNQKPIYRSERTIEYK